MRTILDWVAHWERTAPARPYLHQPLGGGRAQTWTFAQAAQDARRIAAGLRALGLPPKSQIALWSKNSAHWVLADWAIALAGHVSVPLYPTLSPATARYVLEHSETKAIFIGKLDPVWDEARLASAIPPGVQRIGLPLATVPQPLRWDDWLRQHEPLAWEPRQPDELATLIYTSGSTGKPKGVMVSFGAIHAATLGCAAVVKTTADDRMLSYLPMAHVMERWLIASCSIQAGCQVFFAESLETFLADLQRARPTLFVSMPRLWLKFQQGVLGKLPQRRLDLLLALPLVGGLVKRKVLRGLGLDAVRFAGSGSAPVPKELLAWYRALGLELLEGYGMTENFGYSHLTRPGHVVVGTVGTPYPEVSCKLGPDDEVLVKSPATMLGYFKDDASTQAAFTDDGYLRTGDRGRVDAAGCLTLTGRTKEPFKTSKGKFVVPTPIENALLTSPLVELACVLGAGFPQPCAVVVLSPNGKALQQQDGPGLARALEAHVAAVNATVEAWERLDFVAVTRRDWTPDSGLVTPTLKTQRGAIEAEYAGALADWYGLEQPVVVEA